MFFKQYLGFPDAEFALMEWDESHSSACWCSGNAYIVMHVCLTSVHVISRLASYYGFAGVTFPGCVMVIIVNCSLIIPLKL